MTFMLMLLLSACVLTGNTTTSTNTTPPADAKPGSKEAIYFANYKDVVVSEMKRTGIPASIKMAQATLESGYGGSELAKKANNHFGIKCHKDWTGETYTKDGNCYRKYKTVQACFIEHSNFIRDRKHYAHLFKLKITDYKGWANGLHKAGYATDPQYASKLIGIIERYKLYEWDK